MIKLLALGIAVATMFSVSAGYACSPPLLPTPAAGESDANFRARAQADATWLQAQILTGQQQLWDRSYTILAVRVVEAGPMASDPPASTRRSSARTRSGLPRLLPVIPLRTGADILMRAVLQPLGAAKGTLPAARFVVASGTNWTTCGPRGAGLATYARPGELLAVYLRQGPPGTATLLDVLTPDAVVDPRVRGLFDRK